MSGTRKLAAILVSDVVVYSRLAGAGEDRILARPRTLRSDLIDPTIAVHHGRIVKRTGVIAAVIAIAGGAWYFVGANRIPIIGLNAPTRPAHLSIVVLPFANLSGDPAQDYFADGFTENLTPELSRIRNSFVIAPNTAFTYKGKPVDAKEIGKDLGVRYLLEGSVQRE